MRQHILPLALAGMTLTAPMAHATLLDLGACIGPVNGCVIENDISRLPQRVTRNPDNGILLGWDEVQNFTLGQDLHVDRVFDPTASFITPDGDGYLISAGTVVSSHYLQWDPEVQRVNRKVQTQITADSQIFGLITRTDSLGASDFLGLPGIEYDATYDLRGLEPADTAEFNGRNVDIDWGAGSPGDWGRLITAFSPGGSTDGGPDDPGDPDDPDRPGDPGVTPVPLPAGLPLFGGALALLGGLALRRRR